MSTQLQQKQKQKTTVLPLQIKLQLLNSDPQKLDKIINTSLVNKIDPSTKQTAVHIVCTRSDLPLYLLKSILKVYEKEDIGVDSSGNTPLHLLCQRAGSKSELISCLVKNSKCGVNSQNYYGKTGLSLLLSAKEIDEAGVKLMIEFGAQADMRDYQNRESGLHLVSKSRSTDFSLFSYILQSSNFPHLQNGKLETALHVLCNRPLEQEQKIHHFLDLCGDKSLMLQNYLGETPLHAFCKGITIGSELKNSRISLKRLIPKVVLKSNCNQQNFNGKTPLHILISQTTNFQQVIMDCMREIFKKGGNANHLDVEKRSCLHSLFYRSHIKFNCIPILNLFLKNGYNINVKDANGCTLLSLLCSQESPDLQLFKALLNSNADPTIADKQGYLPIQKLCKCILKTDCLDYLKLLQEGGSDINCLDNNNRTLLHLIFDRSSLVDLSLTKYLIETKLEVNALDSNNSQSALHYLCLMEDEQDNEEWVESLNLLLDSGANLELPNENGDTPIHLFLQFEEPNLDVLELLLKKEKIDVNFQNKNGETLLLKYLSLRDRIPSLEIIELLNEYGADFNVAHRNQNENNVLHMLCEIGAPIEIIEYVSEFDLKLKQCNSNGDGLFHCLCYSEEPSSEIFEWLIEMRDEIEEDDDDDDDDDDDNEELCGGDGLDINRKNKIGETPFHILCQSKNSNELIQLCIENEVDLEITNNFGQNGLHLLCLNPNAQEEDLSLLIENDLDINACDQDSFTALMYICDQKVISSNFINILLDAGADPSINDHFAFKRYCKNGHLEIELIEKFLNAGADVNVNEENGNTILHNVCLNKTLDIAILKFFIEKGCKINVKNNLNETPFLLTCKKKSKHFEQIFLFVKNGADINVLDNSGKSPLHYVCQEMPFIGIIKFLVNNGADINVIDEQENILLHYIVASNPLNIESIDFLIEMGLDINKKNRKGETSYSILKKRIGNISQTEQIEIIKFLKKIDLLNENILKEKNFSNKFDYKEIPTKKVLLKKIIKTTAFQTTWVGIWNEKNAFIIQLNDSIYLSDRQLYKIRNEISFISSLSHKFLVKTFGGCTQNQEKILIVSEYHSGGNLRERLNKSSIPNDEKYRIILQIAKGIQYLHSMDIIHGSLFTDKILFDCKNNVKISGFGITRHVPPLAWSLILKTQPVPQSPFQAPELFLHPNITSKKIDIFSFAMIIWEIVTRKDVTNSSWWNYMKFKDALLKGKRPEIKVATAYQELIKNVGINIQNPDLQLGKLFNILKKRKQFLNRFFY